MNNEASLNSLECEISQNGACALRTYGVSMRPLFKNERDVVIISKNDGRLKKYDVALYHANGKYVLHRVIAVRDGEYVMRGDNTYFSETVREEQIIGVLTAFIRNGKRHSTDRCGYKFYSRLWHFIYPLRYFLHRCRGFLSRAYRKIFKKGKK